MFTPPSKVVLYLHKKQQPITDHSSFHIDAVCTHVHAQLKTKHDYETCN